jgi:hypothetical protein
MNLTGIISISGKPGLFKVVAQAKNSIIVESLIDKKRMPAYSTDRISALDDISIYTYEEDVPLREVYEAIYKREQGKDAPSHKESLTTLTDYLSEVLPNYDSDRVYPSDIKKLFQWYNLLNKEGLTKTEEKEEVETAEISESSSEEKPKKKAAPKKASEQKSPVKKDSASKTKSAPTKKTAVKKSPAKATSSAASKKK